MVKLNMVNKWNLYQINIVKTYEIIMQQWAGRHCSPIFGDLFRITKKLISVGCRNINPQDLGHV